MGSGLPGDFDGDQSSQDAAGFRYAFLHTAAQDTSIPEDQLDKIVPTDRKRFLDVLPERVAIERLSTEFHGMWLAREDNGPAHLLRNRARSLARIFPHSFVAKRRRVPPGRVERVVRR